MYIYFKKFFKKKSHAILGFICNNKYYIYNSNNYIFEFYWCDLNRIQIIIFFFDNLQTILSHVYNENENENINNFAMLFYAFIYNFKNINNENIKKSFFYKLLLEVNIIIVNIMNNTKNIMNNTINIINNTINIINNTTNINDILKNYHIYNKNIKNNITNTEKINDDYEKIKELELIIKKIIEYINNYIYPNDFYDNIEKINDENNNNYTEIINDLKLYNEKNFNDRKQNFENSMNYIIHSNNNDKIKDLKKLFNNDINNNLNNFNNSSKLKNIIDNYNSISNACVIYIKSDIKH